MAGTGLLLALLLPGLVSRPVAGQVPVVGYLWLGSPPPGGTPPWQKDLEALGHQEGRTFRLEARWAEGDHTRFPALARELLNHRPAVIYTPCGQALREIREVSRSVPVIAGCADPKNFLGEIATLSRPGGRTTGFAFLAPESAAKRLQLLTELLPNLSRVGILYQRQEDWNTYFQEMERTASLLRLSLVRLPVERADGLEDIFASAGRQRVRALIVLPDAVTFGARTRIATLAISHKLPTVFDTRIFVADGGLMSYGPDWFDGWAQRIIATYIDRILKGVPPGELPVQQPTRLELVVNLRTARMLGLSVPVSFLNRADEVLK